MPEQMSVQLLTQACDNIQKLFDVTTRIDERTKSMERKQDQFDARLDETSQKIMHITHKVAIIEAKELNPDTFHSLSENIHGRIVDVDQTMRNRFQILENKIVMLEHQLALIQNHNNQTQDRWKTVSTFIIQLVWVVLAAYVLTKLNLQSPAVP